MSAAFGWLKMFACALLLGCGGFPEYEPGEQSFTAADSEQIIRRASML